MKDIVDNYKIDIIFYLLMVLLEASHEGVRLTVKGFKIEHDINFISFDGLECYF